MSYINNYNSITITPRNRIRHNYLRNSSEDILKRNNFINYDKIYNQFLTSPYPPMYYQRPVKEIENQYNLKQIKEKETLDDGSNNNNNNNNYQYNYPTEDYNELNLLNQNRINSYNTKNNDEYKYLNYNKTIEDEKKSILSRNKILNKSLLNNRNYHYNDYDRTENDDINNNINNINNQILNNNIHDKNSYDLNEKNLFHKKNNDINNNRLVLSYDNIKNMRENNDNKGYVSPTIAQIAKKNYLGNNPYSDKEQNLGPSMLKSNPILYPIDTYKFDFNRYIKGEYVNKFV